MEWVYIEDIADYEGKEIELRGWVYNKRSAEKSASSWSGTGRG